MNNKKNANKSTQLERDMISNQKNPLVGELNGIRLKYLINNSKYNQLDFADEIGISYTALKRYMKNEVSPPVNIFVKMANLLNCPYSYLLGDTPCIFPSGEYFYKLLLEMGFELTFNPDNPRDDNVIIQINDLWEKLSLKEIEEKVKEYLMFQLYLLDKKEK
ncbi:MAG: helix-turn-helix domain-containing protein [Anaerocolumna sp.]